MPDSSAFKFELAIEKLKSHKSPVIDQIPAELIKTGIDPRSINLLFPFGIRISCMKSGRNR